MACVIWTATVRILYGPSPAVRSSMTTSSSTDGWSGVKRPAQLELTDPRECALSGRTAPRSRMAEIALRLVDRQRLQLSRARFKRGALQHLVNHLARTRAIQNYGLLFESLLGLNRLAHNVEIVTPKALDRLE